MQSKLVAWLTAARWRLSAVHCITALPIQLISAYFFSLWVGAYAVLVFFYSRKVLECQEEAKVPGQSHATVWYVGLLPWNWEFYKILDVALPVATSYLIAFLVGK